MADERSQGAESRLPIKGVAFGVRYAPQYRVRDNLGIIIDNILRSDQFGPDTFPESELESNQHTLLNPANGDRLTIAQADALLDINLKTKLLSDVREMSRLFNSIVIKQLKDVCNVSGAFRFGLLVRFEELNSYSYECPVERYADKGLVNAPAKTLNLRCSYNLPTPEGFSKRGVEDYRNVIYIMNQEEPDRFSLAVDYQHYFRPTLDAQEWAQTLYERFVSQAITYHQGTVSGWVDSIAREAQAAA